MVQNIIILKWDIKYTGRNSEEHLLTEDHFTGNYQIHSFLPNKLKKLIDITYNSWTNNHNNLKSTLNSSMDRIPYSQSSKQKQNTKASLSIENIIHPRKYLKTKNRNRTKIQEEKAVCWIYKSDSIGKKRNRQCRYGYDWNHR